MRALTYVFEMTEKCAESPPFKERSDESGNDVLLKNDPGKPSATLVSWRLSSSLNGSLASLSIEKIAEIAWVTDDLTVAICAISDVTLPIITTFLKELNIA